MGVDFGRLWPLIRIIIQMYHGDLFNCCRPEDHKISNVSYKKKVSTIQPISTKQTTILNFDSTEKDHDPVLEHVEIYMVGLNWLMRSQDFQWQYRFK